MNISFIAASLILILCIWASPAVSEEMLGPLNMDVRLMSQQEGDYQLEVRLTNEQKSTVSVLNIYLPWLSPNSGVLVSQAYRNDPTRSPLPKYLPFSDYIHVVHSISHKEVLEGYVDLNGMFPTLRDDVLKYVVVIEWRCEAKRIKLVCKEGEGGTFTIVGKKPGNSELQGGH